MQNSLSRFFVPTVVIVVAGLMLASAPVGAQSPSLVADINQVGDPSAGLVSSGLTLAGNLIVFSGDDGLVGAEPWISNGSAVGTQVLADVRPTNGGNLGGYTELGSELVFYANDQIHGCEIWKSDLTVGNAEIVTNVNPVDGTACPSNLLAAGDYVYYVHTLPDYGTEMWRTDGTAGGTARFELLPGTDSGGIGQSVAVGDSLYFAGDDGITGMELWRITDAGVLERIDAVDNGVEDFTAVANLFAVNNSVLLFGASDGSTGVELFKTDGGTTSRVADIWSGSSSSYPGEFVKLAAGQVLFAASDGTDGRELWRTDGSATTQVEDINAGAGSSNPEKLTRMGGLVYFFADDSTDRDLWVSDGTGPGTTKVYEMQSIAPGDVIREIVAGSGQLWFFIERTGGVTPPFELWRSDGTTLGTELLMTFEEYFRGGSVARNGRLFFAADDGANGLELWVSDGTTVGTEMVYEHAEPGSTIRYIVADGAGVYLLADDGIVGKELWKSDGTAGGTTLVIDADPSGDGFTSLDGTAFSGGFYFSYDDPVVGRELFRHDGMGITLVDDVKPGIDSSYPYGLFASPTHLFWGADYPTDTTELMMTDGVIIERGDTGPDDDSPEEFVFYDGLTYFSALADTEGKELHRSDGTAAGTELFADLNPVGSGSPEDLTPGLGLLFFKATNGDGGEPWVSDGTVAGTQQLADINPGPDSSNPKDFVEANGLVFFTAYDGLLGGALFVTDGTSAGTQLVFDLDPTSIQSASTDLAPVPGGVVFAAVDATAGREVFFSDGTSATMLKDILPGAPGSAPGWFTALDGRAFFVANDGVNGPELWTSDGTPGGTRLVLDVQPGAGGSGPSWLTPAEGALFFAANDGVTGIELHRYLLPLFGDGFESGDTGAWSGVSP